MKHTRTLGPLTVCSPLCAALLLLTASAARAENHPPVAEDFALEVRQSHAVEESIGLHAYDPDGDYLLLIRVSSPAHGTAFCKSLQTLSYTPAFGFSGLDSFEYTVIDWSLAEASGTVTVLVHPVFSGGYGINPQPGNGIAGLPLSRAPELKGTDEAGNPIAPPPSILSPVLVSLVPGTGTPGAVLLGRAQRAVEVFRWDDIGVDRPGEGYVMNMTLMFPMNPVSLISAPFTIYPASTVPVYQATHPITVDGTLSPDEWRGGPTLHFGEAAQDVIPGMWTGPVDYSGTLRLKWSADALYLAMRVTDDVLSFPETDPTFIWLRDGVEVFLGLKQPQVPARTAYDAPGDFQVILSADANADGTFSGRWYSPQATDRILGSTENVKLVRTPDGYLMEAAIPWTLLTGSTPPVLGQYLGFNVMVKDNDRVPPNEDSAFSLSRMGESSSNPSHWTAALLMGAPVYTLPDVLRALRIAGSLSTAVPEDFAWLDAAPDGAIGIRDAVRMVRKVMYLDPRM